MIEVLIDVFLAVLAGGIGARLGWARGKRVGTAAPKLRPCSCAHGFGAHDKNGCHAVVVDHVPSGPQVVRDRNNDPVLDEGGDVQVVRVAGHNEHRSCACKRFDGQVPPEAYTPLPEF